MSFREWRQDLERRARAAVPERDEGLSPLARFPLDREDLVFLRELDKAFSEHA